MKDLFIELLLQQQVLRFGEFTLKSGRKSPYFFNLGAFNTGENLAKLGYFYAEFIQSQGLSYDMLFGPAYKGIPLVSATAIALATQFKQDKPYCFNRKLKKNYGDGGDCVGAPLQGKVVMVDDVITAGTTVRETLAMFAAHDATLSAIVIAFDRQEKNEVGGYSVVQEMMDVYGVPIYSIVTFHDLVQYLQSKQQLQQMIPQLLNYHQAYGV